MGGGEGGNRGRGRPGGRAVVCRRAMFILCETMNLYSLCSFATFFLLFVELWLYFYINIKLQHKGGRKWGEGVEAVGRTFGGRGLEELVTAVRASQE